MSLIVPWLVFPLALLVLASGCGLLLERLSGARLPPALRAPAGLAVVVVAAQLATATDATAELATPLVVGLAVAGLALSYPWRRGRPDPWAIAAAVAVFAVFAAPVVLSGRPTFAGYIKLDDTATWLAMTDRVMEHGRNLQGLAPSSYEATLASYLGSGYPVGAFLPLGVGNSLTGHDAAWLFQPYLAFLAAMLALTLYTLAARAIEPRGLRALAVFVAAQPALLFGYSLWGGVKELAAAGLIALVAAHLPPLLEGRGGARDVIPLAFAVAATLSVLSVAGAVWLAPALLGALAVVVGTRGRSIAIRQGASFAALGAALSIPSLTTAADFLRPAAETGSLTNESELGNLIQPLSAFQVAGIWPVGDFRLTPAELDATHLLIGVAIVAAAIGVVLAWRRRRLELLAYLGTAALGCLVLTRVGSPWVDAKTLATAAPAFLLAALVGCAGILGAGRRFEAAAIFLAVAGGVLWSNALAYHDVNLAPQPRLAELERIGERVAGQGPTLMTSYEPYGVRHFLRKADPEGASELRRRVVPLRDGSPLERLASADVDRFRLDGLLAYRTLVLRRSPLASRPPSPYSLTWSGRYYEVWQRASGSQGAVLSHVPLGDGIEHDTRADCRKLRRLAAGVGTGKQLAVATTPRPIVAGLSGGLRSAAFRPDAAVGGAVLPLEAGELHARPVVPRPGRYAIWLGGAFRDTVELRLDGRTIARARHRLSHAGQYEPLGTVALDAGEHRATLRYGGSGIRPGSGGPPFALGPLVLSRAAGDRAVKYVPASRAGSLCGRSLDWVEAVSS